MPKFRDAVAMKLAMALNLVDNTSDATKNAAAVILTNHTLGAGTVYAGWAVTAITAAYTISSTDDVVLATPTANITVNLPAVALSANRRVVVRNLATQYVVTIHSTQALGAGNIDGVAVDVPVMPRQHVEMFCDGATWYTVTNPRPAGLLLGRFSRAATTTVASGAVVPLDTDDYNPLGTAFHNTASNPSRITPVTPGYYRFFGHTRQPVQTSGLAVFATLFKNGSAAWTSSTTRFAANSSGSAGNEMPFDDVVYCNGSTDYVEITSGNANATASNVANTVVMVAYA